MPHTESDRLRHAMERCASRAVRWSGVVYRSASPRYANKDDLLTGVGSKTAGGRWNPPKSFPTVYSSLDPYTVLDEVLAHFRYYGFLIESAMPRVIVSVRVRLATVLDLTDGKTRSALRVSERRILDEPWREAQKAGREALDAGLGTNRPSARLGSIPGPIGREEGKSEPHHLPHESLAAELAGDHQRGGLAAAGLGVMQICMQIFDTAACPWHNERGGSYGDKEEGCWEEGDYASGRIPPYRTLVRQHGSRTTRPQSQALFPPCRFLGAGDCRLGEREAGERAGAPADQGAGSLPGPTFRSCVGRCHPGLARYAQRRFRRAQAP